MLKHTFLPPSHLCMKKDAKTADAVSTVWSFENALAVNHFG